MIYYKMQQKFITKKFRINMLFVTRVHGEWILFSDSRIGFDPVI
ncbi:MAG: hypothetical protein ACD_15C00037G0015 [uncultured bacterium]|nr:MAG: hypothetical protein ACD_15C00037G0015 [uncultured bacterium]